MKKQKSEFSPTDLTTLKRCERVIKRGRKQFLATGEALATIREKKLYRVKGYETFEDYCQREWNITRQHASRLILTFRCNEQLSPDGDEPVFNSEGLARRFRQLDPEQQKEIAENIANGASVKDEIAKAEQKKKPTEILQAKKYTLKLWELVERAEDASGMFEALKPLLKWAMEFQERQAKKETRLAEDRLFEEAA